MNPNCFLNSFLRKDYSKKLKAYQQKYTCDQGRVIFNFKFILSTLKLSQNFSPVSRFGDSHERKPARLSGKMTLVCCELILLGLTVLSKTDHRIIDN